MKKYLILNAVLLSFSCAAMREIKENNNVNAALKFRYININLIIEYMSNNDPDARNMKKRKEDILQKINSMIEELSAATGEKSIKELTDKQNQYKQELTDIKKSEENYKSRFLNIIDKALEDIAKKSDIDFIFNISEGTVYAKKEYDITEELLRELIKQKEKSAPVSR